MDVGIVSKNFTAILAQQLNRMKIGNILKFTSGIFSNGFEIGNLRNRAVA
jgi:hypothetical protein